MEISCKNCLWYSVELNSAQTIVSCKKDAFPYCPDREYNEWELKVIRNTCKGCVNYTKCSITYNYTCELRKVDKWIECICNNRKYYIEPFITEEEMTI